MLWDKSQLKHDQSRLRCDEMKLKETYSLQGTCINQCVTMKRYYEVRMQNKFDLTTSCFLRKPQSSPLCVCCCVRYQIKGRKG